MLQQRETGKYRVGNIQCEICINMNVGLETNAKSMHAKELLTEIRSHAKHAMRCPINYDLACAALRFGSIIVCIFIYIVWKSGSDWLCGNA